MEEKDIFKAEESGQVEEQLMLDLPTDIDGEVASFDQQVPQVKSAPPIEVVAQDIDKDIQTVSSDEQKSIDEAQNKAKEKVREYRGVFGDRQIRKTNKTIGLVIGIVAILLIAFFVVSKIPMFYNCMVPKSADSLKYVFEETDIKDVDAGDDVWAIWYEYNERNNTSNISFLPGIGNTTPASFDIFANLDEYAKESAKNYYQMNWMLCQKETNSAVKDEVKYVTVIWYEFDSVEDSKAFAEIQKEKYTDGQYEHKDVLFHQLGMVKGTGEDYVYDAWYNGAYYIEVYATDAEYADSTFVEYVRTQINYNA